MFSVGAAALDQHPCERVKAMDVNRKFSEFRIETMKAGRRITRRFTNVDAAVGWAATNLRLTPKQTSIVRTTGRLTGVNVPFVRVTGRRRNAS